MQDHQTLLARTRSALTEGDIASACELSKQALALKPNDIDSMFLCGLSCQQAGDFDAAISLLEPVAQVAAGSKTVHKALADALRNRKNFVEAEKHYRLAISLEPDSIAEQVSLIAVLADLGRTSDAALVAESISQIAGRQRAADLLATRLVQGPHPVIFDVGANNGDTSLNYLSRFPNAVVHSFEPHPVVFAKLRERMATVPNIVLNDCALGDVSGTMSFNLCNQDGSSSFLKFDPNSGYIQGLQLNTEDCVDVPIRTIDSYCDEANIERIHFLKIDVQGFEPAVIDGAVNMLRCKAIDTIQLEFIFRDFYERPASFFEIERRLIPHGYRLKSLFDIYPGQGSQLFQLDAIYTCLPEAT